jgi:S-DNA-T family DNA segregation ATPase FtsK/SpoIIIE
VAEPDDGPGGELVPFPPQPDAPEVLPAVPGDVPPGPAKAVYADLTRVPGERLPIIPPHLRGRENIRAALVIKGGEQWHKARWHGIRAPAYLLAGALWAVVGVFRVLGRQVRWWWALDLHSLLGQRVAAGDDRAAMRVHKEIKETRQFRGYVLLGEAVVLVAGIAAMAALAPWWAWAGLGAVALPLLAHAGRPDGRPIIRAAIIPPDYSPPTHEIITRALGSLGIPEINKALKDGGPGIAYVSDVMKDGPGWGCHLDLPHGVTATHILAKREELASGLRRPLSATWPAGVPQEHAGRLELWVGFHDISKTKPPAWPLLKARTTDVFGQLPFGTDPRGRPVTVPLFEVNWLIGAAPGQGKTSAVRGLACGVALDVRAEMWLHELAGKGDCEPLARVCHRYCSGLDDASIAYTADSLRMLRGELDRRSLALRKVPREQRPEGKITPELAAARHLRLHPLVCVVDEVQNLFMHPEHGKQAQEDAGYVIRLGRAYGVILVLSTQRPDKESVPTAVTGNVTCRFCLQVPGQVENDLVLGTSSYKNGYNATAFRPATDAGLGWLKADGPPQIVRTYKVDLPEAEKVCARARDMRDRAGTLGGYALGEMDELEARDVLADVLAVFSDAPGLHWDELADRLASRWPERWASVSGESVSAQCRSLGVASVGVKTAGVTLKGCRRVTVERAAR